MYYNTKYGGKRLTKKAEQYVYESRALINLAIEEQNWIRENKYTWLYIDLVFFMPDKRIRDSHNMLKLLLDVMQQPVYHNDYVAMPRIQSVEYDHKNPRVLIKISPQTKASRLKILKLIKTKTPQ